MFFRFCLLLCLVPTGVYAQTPASPQPNIFTVPIRAISNQQPTEYIAILSVSQFADAADKAERMLTQRCKSFTSDLQRPPIQANQVITDFISLQPVYRPKYGASKKESETPKLGDNLVGFELRQNLHVSYTHAHQLTLILQAAAKNEIYELVKIEYRHKQAASIYEDLRKRSYEYLKTKMANLEQIGVSTENWEHYVEEQKLMYSPSGAYQTFATQQTIPSTAPFDPLKERPIWERLASNSQFYQRQPVETYDIVVNQDLLEPVMQFVYDLKIHFILPPTLPKVEYKNEFIMPANQNNYNNSYVPYRPPTSPALIAPLGSDTTTHKH